MVFVVRAKTLADAIDLLVAELSNDPGQSWLCEHVAGEDWVEVSLEGTAAILWRGP